jgi:type VI secretion system secreted protein VgrG
LEALEVAKYTDEGRALSIRTPLGEHALLLEKLTGIEAISQPYHFSLELLAEAGTEVHFGKLLGQRVDVSFATAAGATRKISGILNEVTQEGRVSGGAGQAALIRYHAELVPEFWLLTQRVQSRVFQNQSVWQILETVLRDEWALRVVLQKPAASGTGVDARTPRDYCVQYQESDFAFLSRLMEAEGLYYYFQFDKDGEKLVVTDGASATPDIPAPSQVPYRDEAGTRTEPAVREWRKRQTLRTPSQVVRDFNFERPKPIEQLAPKLTPDQVSVGKATHTLNVQRRVKDTDMLEHVEYPAGFAHFFSGVARGGVPQLKQTENLFPEAERWVKLRREEEAAQAMLISGSSDCIQFLPGHRFALSGHFDAAEGKPIKLFLTRVEHEASIEGTYTGAEKTAPQYSNQFECLPEGLPYRSARVTPRPRIDGYQTAIVVGPEGQEIFVDPFGRVKVKFHWDRRASGGPESSCWVRVAQVWAGKNWGAFFWPRIGNEVVVVFEEGDPDRPLIVGCVYNAENVPPYRLPDMAMLGGFRTRIFQDAAGTKFNALIFHDIPEVEYVQIHSEKNDLHVSEATHVEMIGRASYTFRGRV